MLPTTNDTDTDSTISRRRVLAALGAGTTGAIATTPASAAEKRLVIYQPDGCEGMVEYTICVTGTVELGSNTGTWDSVTNDGTCATGGMGPEHGNDIFTYSGEVESVDISGPAAVVADGEVLHDPDCGPKPSDPKAEETTAPSDEETATESGEPVDEGDEEFCRFDNKFYMAPRGGQISYGAAATHGVETPNGRRVESIEASGRDTYTYAGELSSLWLEGQGYARITQTESCGDESVADKDSVPSGSHDEFCEFNQSVTAVAPSGESATITVGVSHELQLSEGGRRVPATTFEVADQKRKRFTYAGWLTFLAIDGNAEVTIRQPAPCAAPDN